MSNPNPPNKFKKGEPRVNHLTTARVKTERKVRVVYQTVDEPARRCGPRELILR